MIEQHRNCFVSFGSTLAYKGALVWFRPVELQMTFSVKRFIGDREAFQPFYPEIIKLGGMSLQQPFMPFTINVGQLIQVAVLWRYPGRVICAGMFGSVLRWPWILSDGLGREE
jgi:hypothetical protein